jgi:hypothetical protein
MEDRIAMSLLAEGKKENSGKIVVKDAKEIGRSGLVYDCIRLRARSLSSDHRVLKDELLVDVGPVVSVNNLRY